MSDELLAYYKRELGFLRRLGKEFAERNPKIAGRLLLGPDGSEDPHVERMLEGFAYLTARVRRKLDDDFPEISDAMLGVLYPHYQAPIPSMAIAQFVLDRGQGELTGGYTLDRRIDVEAESPDGLPCRFSTCYPVTLWPIEVASASLVARPFAAPATLHSTSAAAVLRLQLRCFVREVGFSQLSIPSLRFYLAGQPQHVYALYELLFCNTLGIALANSPRDPNPVILDRQNIREVGFGPDEGMLPYAARSLPGYRLLSEYFTFPEKFLFFDLAGLEGKVPSGTGNELEIYFYLNRSLLDLEQNVSERTFQLGCAPLVNLHQQRAEPIRLTHTDAEYRVVPDARRPRTSEVYSIDGVTATSPSGDEASYQPFYSFKHGSTERSQRTFWYATRRPVAAAGGGGQQTELFLSLVDLDFQPSAPPDWTLDVETTCLDADRPHRLPWGEGQPRLRLVKGAPVSQVNCLTRPTATFRPSLKRGALWQLISHLSLNHLSLADYEEGADALREILKLYDFANLAATRDMIDGILSVKSRRIVGRTLDTVRPGFCRGLEVTIHFDEDRFSGSGVYPFASVLERFLGLYSNINSFSKLVATTNRREGELRRWTPRTGNNVLL